MRRRELIALVGGAAVVWPVGVRAQQPMPVIGYLSAGSPESDDFRLIAFRQGLNETGYVEGQNVAIEYRWAPGQYDRLPALAADLGRRQVTVIAAVGIPPTFAAKAATSTIPIAFLAGVDPVEFGLIASLNRPGGNITGVAILTAELAGKRLQLLHELVPTAAVIVCWSTRPTPPLPSPRREICRMRHVFSGSSCISCRRAPRARSTQHSKLLSSSEPVHSSSAPTRFSQTSVLRSLRWRPAMLCPRSTCGASSPRPAG